MNISTLNDVMEKQRSFFAGGATLDIKFRIQCLKKLYNTIKKHEHEIASALTSDLGKSDFEGFMCEIGLTLTEISYMIKHTRKLAREKRVHTPLAQFASRSYKKPSPYGSVLIMSPWNYPFLLTIDPLTDAIAAGNCAVVKPSAYSPATSAMIEKIVSECFDEKHVAVITGGREENKALLDTKFDMVFFTGSATVGKEVLRRTAENLTPCVLELGGKSPCIVDESSKIKLAAKRIVFGKYLNCGQTCVAPDYVLVHKSIKDKLIEAIKAEIETQYGTYPLENEDYGKIINKKHFERLLGLIDAGKIVHGGHYNEPTLQIAPTVMDNVTYEDAVMGEEIFGPIMPIITYESIDEVIEHINNGPRPLALYIFSRNKETIKRVTAECQFGGGCVNDTIIHLATTEMGFGGVGESGMGSYHGKEGFNAFSHTKSIVDKKNWIDLPMRYQPYKKGFFGKLLHIFLR